jgi:NAD+ kinase
MQNIIIYDNFYKPEANMFAEKATEFLLSKNINCYVKEYTFSRFQNKYENEFLHIIADDCVVPNADCIISFGGDGTILSAVQQYINEEIPIMGFNVGKLGFLAEFSIVHLEDAIKNLLNKQFKIITRFTLQAQYANHNVIALNDLVIEKNKSKMITVKAFVNEQYVGDYRADGLIITTPTGSTAYSLACGGPILVPDSNVLCITPISPHSLTLRPLVIPNDKEIMFQVFSPSGNANLVVDGSIVSSITSDDTINISLSEKKIKLIVPLESNYFNVIRKKLLWAEYSFNHQQ